MKPVVRRIFPRMATAQLDKNPVTKGGSRPGRSGGAPVVFSAQAELVAGQQATLNAQTLQSGFRTPYFIDEIRISGVTPTYAGPLAFTGLNDAIRIKFQTGHFYFSDDFVPVGLMAPLFSKSDYGIVSGGGDMPFERGYTSIRWLLPRPLYMPAGDVVLANVQLFDRAGSLASRFFAGPACKVTVTYVGRIVAQGFVEDEPRYVPWLAWWTKRLSDAYAEAQTRLRNPFTVPAHVQRFTSRTYLYDSVANNTLLEQDVDGMVQNQMPHHVITVSDSRGYAIVPRFTPVGNVFDTARRAWTFGRSVDSREQFNMQMRSENLAALQAGTDYFTNVGLVGYREEVGS